MCYHCLPEDVFFHWFTLFFLIVDFLEVRFNLNDQTYEPYRRPNNELVYMKKQSNHPPNIIADIPKAISKRLTNISCNKNVFDRNVGIYQAALKNNGLMEKQHTMIQL